MNKLKDIVRKQKEGIAVGIYSACSANEYVIEAVIIKAKKDDSCALIEATANQVDHNGGYTGMKPIDFKHFVYEIAKKHEFPINKIYLGGDHLGPLTFSHLEEEQAMKEAETLVDAYVSAGFTKIHIDTSMKVQSDDSTVKLETNVIARRGARLARVANEAYLRLKEVDLSAVAPVYIIGSEVPIPGGAQEEEEGIQVTKTADLKETIDSFYDAFKEEDILDVWEDVIGVVVQPGVEFGDNEIHEYNREQALHLKEAMKEYPNFVLEGHSTDYQTPKALKEMVEDGIAILKVGPALTFALREALFSLSAIEDALYPETSSNFISVLEEVMLEQPSNWKKHYHGDEHKLALARKYSFSDRARYYLPEERVHKAILKMIENCSKEALPYTLLSQYVPIQYTKIRNHTLENNPIAILEDRIIQCIEEYTQATNQQEL